MKNIFISSTFRDMQEERDLVREKVIPVLREEARKYGDNVGLIDLRWGVDTSTLETDEGAAKVLSVCLDEIDRSHPYMLIFLGERYGWVPKRELIEEAVAGREDKYITDDFEKSVTALEVEYGALSEQYGDLTHCIVCFREPVSHLISGKEKEWYSEQDTNNIKKNQELKERILQALGGKGNLITYSCEWNEEEQKLGNFQSDGQPLEDVIVNCYMEMFQEEWEAYESLNWQDKEQLAFQALKESKLRSFVGRETLVDEYYQEAVKGRGALIIKGESGCGKTTIISKLSERLRNEGNKVFDFFAGAGNVSTSADLLVKQMVYYVETVLGIEKHFDSLVHDIAPMRQDTSQYAQRLEYLRALCAKISEDDQLYICIDALDQLYKDEHVKKLDFLLEEEHVKFIASCLDTFDIPTNSFAERTIKEVSPLRREDVKSVARSIFASYGRNVYELVEQELFKKEKADNPLYVSILIQRLNMMGTEELRDAISEKEIILRATKIIEEMPNDIGAAAISVIQNAIAKVCHNNASVREAVNYIAVSRNGLRMQDLQGIFTMLNVEFQVLDFSLLMKYLDSFFYINEDDRIEFTHKVIKQGLLNEICERKSYETVINEYIKTLDEKDTLRLEEGMYFARICEDFQFAKLLFDNVFDAKQQHLYHILKNEAVEDEGDFYCRLIETEDFDSSIMCFVIQYCILILFDSSRQETQIQLRIYNQLIYWREQKHKTNGNESNLSDLIGCYLSKGLAMQTLGMIEEGFQCIQSAIKYADELCSKSELYDALRDVSFCCIVASHVLSNMGRFQEALEIEEKGLEYAEKVYSRSNDKDDLEKLAFHNQSIGKIWGKLGENKTALTYQRKSIKYFEEYLKTEVQDKKMLNIASAYRELGDTVLRLGSPKEALVYAKKALAVEEKVYKTAYDDSVLERISYSCITVGNIIFALEEWEAALTYYEKCLRICEDLYEKRKTEASFKNLLQCYSLIAKASLVLRRKEDALTYSKKSVDAKRTLCQENTSDKAKEDFVYSLILHGKICFMVGEILESQKSYGEAKDYLSSFMSTPPTVNCARLHIMCLKGLYDCLKRLGREREAEDYRSIAIYETQKLYMKTQAPMDKKFLEELKPEP